MECSNPGGLSPRPWDPGEGCDLRVDRLEVLSSSTAEKWLRAVTKAGMRWEIVDIELDAGLKVELTSDIPTETHTIGTLKGIGTFKIYISRPGFLWHSLRMQLCLDASLWYLKYHRVCRSF